MVSLHMPPELERWMAIRQFNEFFALIGEVRRRSLIRFAVECLEHVRPFLATHADNLASVIKAYADQRISRTVLLESYNAFRRDHYTPHLVTPQGDDDSLIDVGEFDSPGSEAVAAAAFLIVGDFIEPVAGWFHSNREAFWGASAVADQARHAVMAAMPELPWAQEQLPAELEPVRESLLALPLDQLRIVRHSAEQLPLLHAAALALDASCRRREMARDAAWNSEERWQCDMFREVVAPPHEGAFRSEWRTSTVTSLAEQMYETRDFSAMPILADALQDAGCGDENILSHCRGAGPHVCGCWVVDLLLGKE